MRDSRTGGVNNSCRNVNGGPGVNGDGYDINCMWRSKDSTGGSGSPGSTSHSASGGPSGKDFEAKFKVRCGLFEKPNNAPGGGGGGKNADCGAGGTASADRVGVFKGTTWEPGTGKSGKLGGDAGGGGGGGRGGGYWGRCDAQGSYHFCGSSGGGGGAGGCGGPAGPGGQQGGGLLCDPSGSRRS